MSLQNALHWAAKQGNLDVTKLIAGTYQVNPNVKSVSTMLNALFIHL